MEILCVVCGLRELQYNLSKTQDFEHPSKRPEIVSIICKARGITEGLRENKCSYPPGSLQFKLAVELYWMYHDNKRAVMELITRQDENIQTTFYKLYNEVAAKEVARAQRAERDGGVEKLDGLPGKLSTYHPKTGQ